MGASDWRRVRRRIGPQRHGGGGAGDWPERNRNTEIKKQNKQKLIREDGTGNSSSVQLDRGERRGFYFLSGSRLRSVSAFTPHLHRSVFGNTL